MTKVNPYLIFDGNCGEAMQFYQRVLGGKLDVMSYGQSPDPAHVPKGSEERVMHAFLQTDGGPLMASDCPAGMPYPGMHGFWVSLAFQDAATVRRVYDAFAERGEVVMPLGRTFWAESFGMLVDRYGTRWMVMTDTPQA
jgi:PhnB protein